MITIKRLYLIAGFEGADHERTVTALRRLYVGGDRQFISRLYPNQPGKQATYLHALVQDAVKFIFGSEGASNFCRRQDQPCALDPDGYRHQVRTCEVAKDEPVACARARPQVIIVLCADRLFDEVFERLGRATLILRLTEPVLPDANAVKALIDTFEPTATSVNDVVSQRGRSFLAPLVPFQNFQKGGSYEIARDAQADLASFRKIMTEYHATLYHGSFVNPVKRGIRGAYMFDGATAFQQDHLHKSVQIIGAESRRDGFHLLNAYHVYGVKTDPGFHFDVMNEEGGALGRSFTDVLYGRSSALMETHLNITPCDRLV